MPWIDVEEPFAKPPTVRLVTTPPDLDGPVPIDRGLGELLDVAVSGSTDLDLADCEQLEIVDSTLSGVRLTPEPGCEISAQRSRFEDCDLSQTRFTSMRTCRVVGAKLTGTDLSAATLTDVEFEGCTLRFANLRMASMTRVSFTDCTLDEVDGYELSLTDVAFAGTALRAINLDRLTAERVDLRGASEITPTAVAGLTGCLVAEEQLPALVHALALAAGVDIERS